ncbi:PREDICTED: RNA/RNP complex-1-interacting phosphatase-like isoform X1 [Dufourea novaeangliae]|uniref:RNA/RNP complex-1-interacting phosphatase-like isoform X1 n=1 Tax=Dufourea novaeangliae TaxID=178035 RepID=UPI000767BA66|nr:PREDICTED: RNA/RNP complex-1-interacting phosphatase-like isoform X1 [Dufourea novaeangliae]
MPKSIPERWLDYKPYGTVIRGTKILPFKVPLKETVCNNLEPEIRFTTSDLVQAFPRLKCIIDLTNTDRYYDGKEFTSVGIKYEKIWVRGRDLPSMDVVKRFCKVMEDFTSASGEEDIVGVHCTHGVNRSGYLVCRYLVQQLGWHPEETLKAFVEARGYPIEREIYINAVKKTPQHKKIDTSKVSLESNNNPLGLPSASSTPNIVKRVARPSLNSLGGRSASFTMGPPGFAPLRRGFGTENSFRSQHFGFGGPPPRFRHMPPIPPPPGPPPMYGPRPFRFSTTTRSESSSYRSTATARSTGTVATTQNASTSSTTTTTTPTTVRETATCRVRASSGTEEKAAHKTDCKAGQKFRYLDQTGRSDEQIFTKTTQRTGLYIGHIRREFAYGSRSAAQTINEREISSGQVTTCRLGGMICVVYFDVTRLNNSFVSPCSLSIKLKTMFLISMYVK